MGDKRDDEPRQRPRSFTMVRSPVRPYHRQLSAQDASVQTGGSPAPVEMPQEGQVAGDLAGRPAAPDVCQAMPDVVQQYIRQVEDQSVGQAMGAMGVQRSEVKDAASGSEVPTFADDGDEMEASGAVEEPGVPQETTEGHSVAQISQESEIADNENNAILEAQMKSWV